MITQEPAALPSAAEILAHVGTPQNYAEVHLVALMRQIARDLAEHDRQIAALDGQHDDAALWRRESAQRDRWSCYDRLAAYAHAAAVYREYGAQQAMEGTSQ